MGNTVAAVLLRMKREGGYDSQGVSGRVPE